MQMNNHQKRLWKEMIELIQSYLDSQEKDFNKLVGNLEGALDATEINDTALINQWYEFWTPLEIHRALNRSNTEPQSMKKELKSMQKFLIEILEKKFTE